MTTELGAGRQRGLFEVLFVNDKGEVTEGSITNIVSVRMANTRPRRSPADCCPG